MSLIQFYSKFLSPHPCGVLQHMLVGDVTGGNNMACYMEVHTAVNNGLTMQVYGQNAILLFNLLAPEFCI
jgi:hypothetical protein